MIGRTSLFSLSYFFWIGYFPWDVCLTNTKICMTNGRRLLSNNIWSSGSPVLLNLMQPLRSFCFCFFTFQSGTVGAQEIVECWSGPTEICEQCSSLYVFMIFWNSVECLIYYYIFFKPGISRVKNNSSTTAGRCHCQLKKLRGELSYALSLFIRKLSDIHSVSALIAWIDIILLAFYMPMRGQT